VGPGQTTFSAPKAALAISYALRVSSGSLTSTAPGTPSRSSYEHPYVSAAPFVSSRTRFSTSQQDSSAVMRVEMSSTVEQATKSPACPDWKAPTVTTAGFRGDTFLDTMV